MNHTFIIKNEFERANAISAIKNMPLSHEVTIKPHDPKRSNQANSLAHVWAEIIGRECGYGKNEMYRLLKAKFIGTRELEFMGIKFTEPLESKNLSKEQYSEFLNHIQALATTLSIQLPIAHEESYA